MTDPYLVSDAIVFLIGLLFGSFLNVCIYRLPRDISITYSYSRCPSCGNRILWRDLIPVVSYLLLRGACRHCRNKIPPKYPLIELLNGVCWLLAYRATGFDPQTMITALLLSVLIVIAFIDAEHMIIPDSLNYIILLLAAPYILAAGGETLLTHIIGFFAVSVILLIVIILTKGGMGGGDVKFMAAAGLFLGYRLILLALLVGSVVGSIVSLILIANKKAGLKTAVPFGPFLALGVALAALYGDAIMAWYHQLLR